MSKIISLMTECSHNGCFIVEYLTISIHVMELHANIWTFIIDQPLFFFRKWQWKDCWFIICPYFFNFLCLAVFEIFQWMNDLPPLKISIWNLCIFTCFFFNILSITTEDTLINKQAWSQCNILAENMTCLLVFRAVIIRN